MKLISIYEHMENGALKVPANSNCKIVFRHSIRGKISSGVGRQVSLTNEGIELCKTFGRYLQYEIGFVASSSCLRNIETCENILLGANTAREIILAPNELEGPQTKFNSIEDAANIMLDYIFENGNEKNKVDLFCTHDFQMAILYAHLFDFASSRKSIEKKKWPMMLEGMIFWGNRKHFWCSWRNEIKEFEN